MTTLSIGTTTKGRRIWLQGLDRYEWNEGQRYTTKVTPKTITLTVDPEAGKKKVSRGKGGVIDLCGQWVTKWADGHNAVNVSYTPDCIVIRRGE